MYLFYFSLHRGVISSSHPVWRGIDRFQWGKSATASATLTESTHSADAELSPLTLKTPTGKQSTAGGVSTNAPIESIVPTLINPFSWTSAAGFPSFTNYTVSMPTYSFIHLDNFR